MSTRRESLAAPVESLVFEIAKVSHGYIVRSNQSSFYFDYSDRGSQVFFGGTFAFTGLADALNFIERSFDKTPAPVAEKGKR